MKDNLIRNWTPGDRKAGISAALKKAPEPEKAPADMEAVFSDIAHYMDSLQKKDGTYFKREVAGNMVELTGPGVSMRLSVLLFDEVIDEITGHIASLTNKDMI